MIESLCNCIRMSHVWHSRVHIYFPSAKSHSLTPSYSCNKCNSLMTQLPVRKISIVQIFRLFHRHQMNIKTNDQQGLRFDGQNFLFLLIFMTGGLEKIICSAANQSQVIQYNK